MKPPPPSPALPFSRPTADNSAANRSTNVSSSARRRSACRSFSRAPGPNTGCRLGWSLAGCGTLHARTLVISDVSIWHRCKTVLVRQAQSGNRPKEGSGRAAYLESRAPASVDCGDGDEGAAARRDGERSRPGFGLTAEPPTPARRLLSQRRVVASNPYPLNGQGTGVEAGTPLQS
jgi:hypothetical protein